MSLEYVFWGYSLYDLLLSLGRFVIAVSGSLLVILNVLWLVRQRYRVDRRVGGTTRAVIEAVVGAALAAVYWRQVYNLATIGSATPLTGNDTLIVVWAFAGVVTGLLVSALAAAKDVAPPHRTMGHERHGDPPHA